MESIRNGRFNAVVIEHGLAETGESKLATFTALFRIEEECLRDEVISAEFASDVPGYFYLEKKNGGVNTHAVNSIKEAFGWNGSDLNALNNDSLVGQRAQIVVEMEEYNNKIRPKIKYLNALGSTAGGIAKGDDQQVRSIANRIGSKLRAIGGGSKVPSQTRAAATAAPAKATSTAPAPAKPAPVQRPVPASELDLGHAWSDFCGTFHVETASETMEEAWHRAIQRLFPGRGQPSLTKAELQMIVEDRRKQLAGPAEMPDDGDNNVVPTGAGTTPPWKK